jgi:hypothetical protein
MFAEYMTLFITVCVGKGGRVREHRETEHSGIVCLAAISVPHAYQLLMHSVSGCHIRGLLMHVLMCVCVRVCPDNQSTDDDFAGTSDA